MNTALSDLFFKLDMSEYYAEGISDEERESFLHKQATEFAGLVGDLGHEVSAEEVIEDYKNRV